MTYNGFDVTSGAAAWCSSYDFGDGTSSYLGAVGEWSLAYTYKDEVDYCMEMIDGLPISTGDYHWTSTQYNKQQAWRFSWANGDADYHPKIYDGYREVRAFGSIAD